jgi:hypothetical protein
MSTIRGPRVENGPEGSKMIPTAEARFTHSEKIERWEHSFKKKWWKAERERIISMIDEELIDPPIKQSARRKLTGPVIM